MLSGAQRIPFLTSSTAMSASNPSSFHSPLRGGIPRKLTGKTISGTLFARFAPANLTRPFSAPIALRYRIEGTSSPSMKKRGYPSFMRTFAECSVSAAIFRLKSSSGIMSELCGFVLMNGLRTGSSFAAATAASASSTRHALQTLCEAAPATFIDVVWSSPSFTASPKAYFPSYVFFAVFGIHVIRLAPPTVSPVPSDGICPSLPTAPTVNTP